MDLGLRDRVYVVTGGTRGLGLACARQLVGEGARVVVSARDQQGIDEAVAELGSTNAVGVPADLSDASAAERVVAAAVARFGRLDGALVSVGGPAAGTPMTTDDETWRISFETVFLGALRVARAAANAMTTPPDSLTGSEGSLLLILSSSSKELVAGLTTSNGLRPGLAMMVKDLADELGGRGIRVNGIMPGRLATDRMFAIDARLGAPDMVRRRNESAIPLGRYGEPDELGKVAAFLLSPAASYVSGSIVPVDGGMLRSF
ncbi:MAG: SDR family oxidoreductase [Actinobacteria bacterium]|jgi:3-oxoacyl-[acyl-carrier protein] reductase|nr:SDR family oxidoreductase [Actinomycetota bacterium]